MPRTFSRSVDQAPAETTTAAAAERPKSQFWLNIGFTIPGAGKNGEDIFISLPQGIALDDMKPLAVRGNSVDWQHLVQAKNAFLERLQQGAAELDPGARVELSGISVELHRVGQPEQTGTAESNPLIAGLDALFGGKKS